MLNTLLRRNRTAPPPGHILLLLLCAGVLFMFAPQAAATPACQLSPAAAIQPRALQPLPLVARLAQTQNRLAVTPAASAASVKTPAPQSRQNSASKGKTPPDAKSITVATRSLTHKDHLCAIMVNYPQVNNDKVDAELDFWANKTVRTFLSGIGNIAGADGVRYSMLVDYELTVPSERFLSIVFRISTETGGLHPDSGMVTFTYDLSDGRKLGIQDLFGDPSGLLHFLSLYSYESLLAELGSSFENSIKHGTNPDFLNFSLFSLQPDGMTLYFPPYQVADYTLGEKQVRVDARQLQPYKPHPGVWNGSASFGGNTQLGQARPGAAPSIYPK